LLEERLALYTALLTAGERDALRALVLDAGAAHPSVSAWADVLRERAPQAATGEEAKPGAEALAALEGRGRGARGGVRRAMPTPTS